MDLKVSVTTDRSLGSRSARRLRSEGQSRPWTLDFFLMLAKFPQKRLAGSASSGVAHRKPLRDHRTQRRLKLQ